MRTIVHNISGQTLFLGFLPPHGKTLVANQTVVVNGDLMSVLASGRNRFSREREIHSLDYAVESFKITLTHEADPSLSSYEDGQSVVVE